MDRKKTAIYLAIWQALSFVLMGVWIRLMGESFSPNQQIFWRLFLASLTSWIIFGRYFNKSTFKFIKKKDWSVYLTRSLLNYSIGVSFFTIAILNADLATVSFISSLPIMGLLAWLIFKERFTFRALPYIILSIIGLLFLTELSISNYIIGFGALAALVSLLGFDLSYLMVRLHPKELNNYHNTTIILTFSWVLPLIILLINNEPIIPNNLSSGAYIGLGASVVFNILGLYTLNYIFSNLKAYVAGNILLLEGVFAILIGYIFYGELYNLQQLLGSLIIIFAAYKIAMISRRQNKAQHAPHENFS
jgi:drug/metabolite transporter (DMT)-like permease